MKNKRDRIYFKRIVCCMILAIVLSILTACDSKYVSAEEWPSINAPPEASSASIATNNLLQVAESNSSKEVDVSVSAIKSEERVPAKEPDTSEKATIIEKYKLSEDQYEEYKKAWQRPVNGGQVSGMTLDEYIGMMEEQRISHENMRITPQVDIDEFGDDEPDTVEVLDGVDVSALCLMNLEKVIDTLGSEHSAPAYYSELSGESIVYKGSCIFVYFDGDLRRNENGDFAPQLDLKEDIDAIIIRQEVDIYKGISVGKTLEGIKNDSDFLNKIGEPFSKSYEELTLEGYYEYQDILIKVTMFFDDNNYCVEVMLQPVKIPRI